MKRSVSKVLLVLLLCLVPPAGALAGEKAGERCISAEDQFSFAESYFARGEYYRAIGEYERLAHFFPDDALVPAALFRIGESYFKGEKYAEAEATLDDFLSRFPKDGRAAEARMLLCECSLAQGDKDAGLSCLAGVAARSQAEGATPAADAALTRMGWVYADSGDWPRAKESFGRVSGQGRAAGGLDRVAEGLSRADEIPRKSPLLAGALSVVPGAGQLYVGRPRDALFAFLLNGALIWAAAESFRNGQDGLGAAVSIVGAGFYAGNIHGAVTSAEKYNRDAEKGFVRSLRTRIGLLPGGASLSFTISLR